MSNTVSVPTARAKPAPERDAPSESGAHQLSPSERASTWNLLRRSEDETCADAREALAVSTALKNLKCDSPATAAPSA